MLEVLDDIKFNAEYLNDNSNVEFKQIIDSKFVDGWLGDVVRVKQIILNLVSNALKFTKRGSVKLTLKSIEKNGKLNICINVTDSGIGMSKEAQKRIFKRFVQADNSTTREFGGTCLGTSITVNLIKMMDGSIELESQLGKGTRVQILLPLPKVSLSSIKDQSKSVEPPNLQNKSILVAEDNKVNQVIIKKMLSATDAKLTFVENGKLAVDAISKSNFDMVLMDIQMPVMDGIESFKNITKIRKGIPIIALTANVMVEDVNRYLEIGFVEHIGKPIDIDVL